jgi:hypothetical protein
VRRKKCPEDFVDRKGQIGVACSTCFKKGLDCGPPSSAVEAASQSPPLASSQQKAPDSLQKPASLGANAVHIQPIAASHSHPNNASNHILRDLTFDASWLDNFFKEFSSLSDPIYQDAVWLANETSVGSTRLVSDPPSASAIVNAEQPVANLDQDYERIVESHELDSLLERYSALYEQLWRAVITSPTRDEDLTRGIVALSRSSKACRSAAVAICLSYHHIMQRERMSDRQQASFGLTHFLLSSKVGGEENVSRRKDQTCYASATKTGHAIEWPSKEEGVGLAYKWYRFALDEYRRTGRAGTLEQRLSTLLNLRWTIIALDGCLAGRAFMEEIRSLLSETGVTTAYMRQTVRQGTLLSLIVQSVLAADIFDAAAMTGQRCAIRELNVDMSTHSPLANAALGSRVLSQDLQDSSLFDYEFTSCLSVETMECTMQIANLAVDLQQGRTGVETERRKQEILHAIRSCQFKKSNLIGTAGVRAMALHEMWRQSTLIYYYQAILQLGPLARLVQDALEQILSLVDMLSTSLRASEAWDMWMVWFLAGSVAVQPEHRAKCLSFLEGLGSEKALLDNIQVLRAVWRATDESGRTQDWATIAAQQGIAVCYGF